MTDDLVRRAARGEAFKDRVRNISKPPPDEIELVIRVVVEEVLLRTDL